MGEVIAQERNAQGTKEREKKKKGENHKELREKKLHTSGDDGDDKAGIDIRRLHCHGQQALTFLLSPTGCLSSRGQ